MGEFVEVFGRILWAVFGLLTVAVIMALTETLYGRVVAWTVFVTLVAAPPMLWALIAPVVRWCRLREIRKRIIRSLVEICKRGGY